MNDPILDDLLQDIEDDRNFPKQASKQVRVEYLRTQQIFNPHIKEAVDIYEASEN